MDSHTLVSVSIKFMSPKRIYIKKKKYEKEERKLKDIFKLIFLNEILLNPQK